ncbi:hypothetical protein SAMN04488012_101150 [Palleronia salina]|uniref:Uncharacterized protein n=1 Tax=Palleronia salina TaxID=313368 RepID=A0A1M6AJT5_9RHOB|nr:hypothetical protein [Palleronia salina]SHI36677.1 hypothetical protein SAMN04488012_101150 [Palleronia salina]
MKLISIFVAAVLAFGAPMAVAETHNNSASELAPGQRTKASPRDDNGKRYAPGQRAKRTKADDNGSRFAPGQGK